MIHCENVNRIYALDFSSYLLLPQYSHSYLKYEKNGYSGQVKTTQKMELGSLVDAIRTDGPVNMASPLYASAKKIASLLKSEFGFVLDLLQKQVSYTGDMILTTGNVKFSLPVKTRPDFVAQKKFILDLKLTSEKNIDNVAKFLGYPNQMFGYGKMDGCDLAFLLIHNIKTSETKIKRIGIGDTNNFWEEKILKFGKVI